MTTFRLASAECLPTPAPTPLPANRAYFPAFDGVRAVAFLIVFAYHYLDLPWGWTGVNIFFVLSGFLITGILYDTRDQLNRVSNFYIRRILRIFPLYYGVIFVLVLLYPIFRWQWSWSWIIWPAYLGNMARWLQPGPSSSPSMLLEFARPLSHTFPKVQLYLGHFWSLCVEEQFYLIWPWVVFGIRDRNKLIRVCMAGLIALPLLRILTSHILPHEIAFNAAALITVTPLPFDALLLGGLIALLHRGPWAHRLLPIARIGFVIITAGFLFWLARHPGARHIIHEYPYPPWAFTWGVTFIDAISACILVMAMQPGSITFRLFNPAPLRWLGQISYGAYVFHDILHTQILRLVTHDTPLYSRSIQSLTAALAFVLTLLIAWASFRWFEGPFIRLKDRWTTNRLSLSDVPQRVAPERMHNVA